MTTESKSRENQDREKVTKDVKTSKLRVQVSKLRVTTGLRAGFPPDPCRPSDRRLKKGVRRI